MLIPTEVKAIKETPEGTELIIKVNDKIKDQILRYREGGKVLAEIRINDGRTITSEQRKKYFATLKDIADWTGNDYEYMHGYFKLLYCYRNRVDNLSMSNCSMTEAREMINYLMDFAITQDIPLTDLGLNRTDDIDRYLYSCLMARRCVLCGKPADIHHIDTIGMGSDRKEVIHVGKRAIALCREHHNLAHSMGKESFEKEYKVYGIKLTEQMVKRLGL